MIAALAEEGLKIFIADDIWQVLNFV